MISSLPPLIVIGSSTGGPNALSQILSKLPDKFNAVVVIIQHVEQEFSSDLVHWLDTRTSLKVKLASAGEKPKSGIVYVAGTKNHLIFAPDFTFAYISKSDTMPYHPSIDIFFKSIVKDNNKKHKGMAILLTGMGKDGAEGMLALYKAGWHTIAQDEQTSVVYGMPKAAREIGAASEVLPLDEIPLAILRIFS